MKLLKFLLLIICLSISSILLAQRKPIMKLEFAAGFSPEFIEIGRSIQFFPAIQVPITQHLDLGISYNSIKHNTNELADYRYYADTTGKYFDVTRNFASLYITWNFSNLTRSINPVLGYIVSTTKGSVEFPANSSHSVDTRRNLQNIFQKSYIAHGVQAGVDIRVSRIISILIRARVYDIESLLGPTDYSGPDTYYPIAYFYPMLGTTININGSKKRGIK